MSDLITRTARLVPYAKRPRQVPNFVTAYAYEPLPDDPAEPLGNLYVVIEVLVSGRSSEEVADLVISSLGDHYYNQPGETTPTLDRFETAIKATNHSLSEYVNDGNASWIGKMSAVAAVQVGNELHLAQTGSAEAYLYRGKASTRVTSGNASRTSSPTKTFGSIASGQLEAGDRLLMATPALIHQISLTRLHSVVMATSPNTAIAEISELLRGTSSDRISALVIELTTPELAALQVRSDEPDEIQLGTPENALDAARMATSPIAAATVASSKIVGAKAKIGWQRAQPFLQRCGFMVAGWLRRFLTGKGAPRRLGIAVIAILIIAGTLAWNGSRSASLKSIMNQYSSTYQLYQEANQDLANDQKDAARTALNQANVQIASIVKSPNRKRLDAKLGATDLPQGEPTTVAGLSALITDALNNLDGLSVVNPTTVVSFSQIKNAKPTHFELNTNKLYAFDSNNNSAIYIVNTTTNSIKTSAADTAKLGSVLATTLSSANDGIFILTAKPAVWFYSFAGDTLAEQSVGIGGWEPATSIASYATNLYLLGDQAIYKHLKTIGGYAPKTEYLTAAQTSGLTDAKAIAVDGAVYVISPTGLRQYLAGVLKATAVVPDSLSGSTILRSVNAGSTIISSDPKSNRIGYWDASKSLVLSRQFSLNGVKSLYDVTQDAATSTDYALVDGRIVKFTN